MLFFFFKEIKKYLGCCSRGTTWIWRLEISKRHNLGNFPQHHERISSNFTHCFVYLVIYKKDFEKITSIGRFLGGVHDILPLMTAGTGSIHFLKKLWCKETLRRSSCASGPPTKMQHFLPSGLFSQTTDFPCGLWINAKSFYLIVLVGHSSVVLSFAGGRHKVSLSRWRLFEAAKESGRVTERLFSAPSS